MGIKKTIKKSFNVFNPLRYVGAASIKNNGRFIYGLYQDLMRNEQYTVVDSGLSFEKVMEMEGVSEKQLEDRQKNIYLFLLFIALGLVASSAYMLYLFFIGHVFSGLFMVLLIVILLVHGWREHFFLMKIKHRRVKMSIKEWAVLTLMRK